MALELIPGHLYTATIPGRLKSPRQYKLIRIRNNHLFLRYGWFGFADGTHAGPDDSWTWSPEGVFKLSIFSFTAIADLGPSPEEGDKRRDFAWSRSVD